MNVGPRRTAGARARGLALGALALVVSWCVARSIAVAEDDAVASAERRLRAGDAAGAVEALRALVGPESASADPRVLSVFGEALVATGAPAEAVAVLQEAVKRRGTPLDRTRLAEALVATGSERAEGGPRRTVDVVPWLQDAIATARSVADPEPALRSRLRLAEGRAQRLLGAHDAAKAALSDPSLATDRVAKDLLARVLYEGGEPGEAARVWTELGEVRGAAAAYALARDARTVDAYLELLARTPGDRTLLEDAANASVLSNAAPALEAGLARLAATPDLSPRTDYELARARGRLAELDRRPADAVAPYRAAVARAPDPTEAVDAKASLARALLGSAPDDAAAVDEAVALYLEVLAAKPDDPYAREGLSYQARRDGEAAPRAWPDTKGLDRCVRLFRALADADPTDGLAWIQLGNALRLASRPDEAVAAFDRATEVNPYDAGAWNDRGIALLGAGRDAEALASFERATVVDPSDRSPRQNAGRRRWLAGEYALAEEHLAQALRSARASSGHVMLYRGLLDRCWRSRHGLDAR